MEVWIVDDDESIRWVFQQALEDADVTARSFEGGVEALDALAEAPAPPNVLVTDVRMPGMDGHKLIDRVREAHPTLPIIIMTAHSDLDSAVAAYQTGAFEYLPKPFDLDVAIELVIRAARSNEREENTIRPEKQHAIIVGEAPSMQEVFRAIGRLSRSNISVMVTGESGTGKELVAQALHEHSPRGGKPFIAVNTAAIPRDLMESEFFGHEKGAFTGATAQRRGRFEQANGGTLFLDEIGDMPADLQTRLLRVLSDGQFYRVGGHVPVQVDVRVIAATNQELETAVSEGRFREDLYHRLNVIRIRIPPLRERLSDVPLLLTHFLARASVELDVEAKRILPDAVEILQRFNWPGNVRQLENVCRWMTVMAPGADVHVEDLPPEVQRPGANATTHAEPASDAWPDAAARWTEAELQRDAPAVVDRAVALLENAMIDVALRVTNGHKQEAAKRLGWGRNTLTRKLAERDKH